MKKIGLLCLVLIALLVMGADLTTARNGIGTLRSAYTDASTADVLHDEDTSKWANKPAHAKDLDNDINAIEIWFTGNADADSTVVWIYAARPGGDIVTVWTGTLTCGTLDSTTGKNYIDTFATTTSYWGTTVTETDSSGGNRIARLHFDTMGYKWFWVLYDDTTVTGDESYVAYYSGF
jgi:hypothetical protein